jgi:carbon-monoxide dehydrogenase medium subunit
VGGSLSVADPSSDWPALVQVLDVEIVCQGPNGKRSVAASDFIIDSYITSLLDGELVTEVRIKVPPENSGGAYIGFKKAAPSYPAAAAGVQLTLGDGDVCKAIRIVLGAAGPVPVTSKEVEQQLVGESLSDDRLAQAAKALVALSDPPADARGSSDFKRAMLRSLVVKAAKTAIRRAAGQNITGSHDYV